MCFVWISEQTAIISLYSINWLVFITVMECVYCAVGAEYLNTIEANLGSNAPHALHLHVSVTKRTNDRSLGTFQKQYPFTNPGAFDRIVLTLDE